MDWTNADKYLERLHKELMARRPEVRKLSAYYDGLQPTDFASERFQRAFGWLLEHFSDNWMRVVVDAKEERLRVVGFRTDDTGTADEEALRIWQANDMDAQAQMAHTESLIHGESYATVWMGEQADTPTITVEHPARTIVQHHHRRLNRPTAALRTYLDDDGHECAELFLPDGVYLYRSAHPASKVATAQAIRWERDDREYRDAFQENPWGRVPVVALPNAPRLGGGPIHLRSELAAVIPLQDMLNKLMVDMVVASEFQSFRQRWATGLELEYDEAGKPIQPFQSAADRLWVAEGKEVKFGEFGQVDLAQYVKAVDAVLVHVSSIASVPPHYLNASADRLSGESIKAAESGLVSKVRRKMIHYGDAWEEVMRLAGLIGGNAELAQAVNMETIWADPEIRTDSALADAAVKRKEAGVPWAQRMEDLGYSPAQIARMKVERQEEALLGLLSNGVANGATAAAGLQTGAPGATE